MAAKDRLARGLKMTFVARVVRVLSNAVLMVLLTRFLLSPDEYGILFLALSIIGVARLFSDLGLSKSAAPSDVPRSPRSNPHVPSLASSM